MWITKTLSSSIGKKLLMALTGLFLITFLVVHAVGNLQLFKSDNGEAFNIYTKFMTTNPLIKTVSYLLYFSIILHAIDGFLLWYKNSKSRPVGYHKSDYNANSIWASRNMGILGTLLLIFIVVHMKTFWAEMHFGSVPVVTYNGEEYKDLYSTVTFAFSQLWYVILYTICMLAMAFHLWHGFGSAFQTLGLNHKKYTPFIQYLGYGFAVIISAVFASMPLYMYISQLN
jgi:succinate dehydrogenase / fumarate reductase, cytochrome b subunit